VAKLKQILARSQARHDLSAVAQAAAPDKTAQGIDIAGSFREIAIKCVFSGNCSLALFVADSPEFVERSGRFEEVL
jgi:hypothetical protein